MFAFVLNAVFLAVCVVFTSFAYEDTTDFYNSLYICQRHVYSNFGVNYILAILIGTVQYALPGFNCFVLFEVLASFAAFTSITFVFADKYNKRKAFVFSTLLSIMFSLHHYSNLNSTRTAALLCASGFLLVLLAIHQKRYTLSCWVGVMEIVFGSFLSITYFFVALGFAIAFFFGDMIAKKKYRLPFRKLFWYFRPFLLMFLLVTLVSLGLCQFSYTVNHATDASATFYEYTAAKNAVSGLPYPGYTDHIAEFEAVGIKSDADYELLKSGYYDEENALNAETVKAVHEMQRADNPKNIASISYAVFEDIYGEITSLSRSIIVIAVYLMVSLLFILYHKNRFSFFPLFYLIVGYLSGFFLRFIYDGGDNMTYGIWAFMIVMLLNSFNFDIQRSEKPSTKLRMHNGYMLLSCAVVLALAVTNGIIYYNNRPETVAQNSARFLISELDRNPDCYYVMDPVTEKEFIKNTENYVHPMWGFRENYLDNLDSFGFFRKEETLRRRNLPENIYKAVLTPKKIYVIDNNIVFKKEKYFSEHYTENNARAFYDLISEPEGYKIYKVRANG